MGYRIHPLAAAIAVAFSSSVAWQNAAAQENKAPVLGDVVVSASKVQPVDPESTTLNDRALAPLRAATSDTASLLRDVPGVQLQSAGGTSSLPVLRGLADDRNRTLVDDMDLIASCPNHMNSPLSYLDPSNVASLKVYPGISPVSVAGDPLVFFRLTAFRSLWQFAILWDTQKFLNFLLIDALLLWLFSAVLG